MAIDPTERHLYVAGSSTDKGEVWHVPLFKRRGGLSDGDWEAVGGGGIGEPSVKVGPSVHASK